MIQTISAWDVVVFPDGRRSYRLGIERIPLEAQIHPVGSPDYKTEVAVMREQAKAYFEKMCDAEGLGRNTRILPAGCPCPNSRNGMEGNRNAAGPRDPNAPPTTYALRHRMAK